MKAVADFELATGSSKGKEYRYILQLKECGHVIINTSSKINNNIVILLFQPSFNIRITLLPNMPN